MAVSGTAARHRERDPQATPYGVVESSTDAIIVHDLEGRILAWTAGAQCLYGYTAEEAVGHPVSLLSPPEHVADIPAILDCLRRDEPVEVHEAVHVRKDGSLVDVAVTVSPIRGAAGEVVGALVLASDLSARTRAQAALQASEARFRAVFEGAGVGVAVLDLDARIVEANPALARILGHGAGDLVGQHFGTLTDPDGLTWEEDVLRPLVRGESDRHEVDRRYTGAAGQVVWGHEAVWLIQDAAGRPQFAICTVEDVGERVRALDVLRETSRLSGAVIDALPVPVLTVDPAGRIQSWNPAAERLSGVPAAGMVGRALPLQRREDAPLRELFERVMAGATVTEVELERNRSDGSTLTLSVAAAPLTGPGGEITGVVGLFTDAGERKRTADELAQSLAALDERRRTLEAIVRQQEVFIFSVAHDLRAPLMTLQSMTDILLTEFAEDFGDESRVYLERMAANVERMQSLLDELREYSRVGRIDVEFEEVDLNRVAGEVVAGMVEALAHRGAKIRTDGALPTVWANPVRMAEVFQNLIDNAVTYTPPEREPVVVLAARDRGDAWEIQVRDNGVGIPAAYARKVFEVFQRLSAGKALNPAGSGLGLTIVARIIEVHGGRIWVESEERVGTTIHFTIPKRHGEEIPDAGSRKDRGR